MGKVLWHVTMSLDGFIAGPGDDMGWMSDFFGPNPIAEGIIGQVGAVLMGAHTYRPATTAEGEVYGGAWRGPQFVLTHAAPDRLAPGFIALSGDIGAAVRQVQAAAGDKYAVILGARTARQVLAAGLLDEILVHLAPILLGDGVRLFEQPGGTRIALEPISLTPADKVANLWYRVKK